MRRRHLAICTLVALATVGAGSAQAAQPQQHFSPAARTLLTAINSARAAAGVPPLRASASLTNAASWQSQALAGAGYLDHTSPDGSTLIDRLTRVRWHANLLSPSFRTVGLGLARGSWNGRGALYVTADFGA